ncbi:phage major capsid protein [Blautia producta]|uniref:phage major capsid protein n=1 Tax=Blautia producta TaxID=33035 RepID=UPI0036F3B3AD
MKIDELEKELKEQVLQLLNDAEDKSEAIYQAADMIATAKHKKLIDELTEQNARAAVDGEYRKRLGLRNLSGEEKQFYEKFKDIKQAITAKQVDIIPEEIIDRTLDDIKKKSDILKLVRFAPANVKRWLVAEHSGAAQWGPLTEEITAELSASFSSLNIEVGKLHVALVIPKAIQDLALPFVDRYFTAILAEAMQDGLVRGFLDGDGKEAPIGIMRMIGTTNEDGTNKAKTVLTNIKKFSPKGLAGVRKTLTKNGMRSIGTLYLICNPKDEAEFVDPALYGESLAGGYRNTSFMNIEKIVDANVPEGKAIFTIADMYVMGASSIDMRTYDQTKAMEDADVIIGKCYANGRAVDNDTAVVFDVTKLEEYVLPVTQVTAPTA